MVVGTPSCCWVPSNLLACDCCLHTKLRPSAQNLYPCDSAVLWVLPVCSPSFDVLSAWTLSWGRLPMNAVICCPVITSLLCPPSCNVLLAWTLSWGQATQRPSYCVPQSCDVPGHTRTLWSAALWVPSHCVMPCDVPPKWTVSWAEATQDPPAVFPLLLCSPSCYVLPEWILSQGLPSVIPLMWPRSFWYNPYCILLLFAPYCVQISSLWPWTQSLLYPGYVCILPGLLVFDPGPSSCHIRWMLAPCGIRIFTLWLWNQFMLYPAAVGRRCPRSPNLFDLSLPFNSSELDSWTPYLLYCLTTLHLSFVVPGYHTWPFYLSVFAVRYFELWDYDN